MDTLERYRNENDLVDVQLLNGMRIRVDRCTAAEILQGIEDRQLQEQNDYRQCLALAPVLARSH